MDTGYESSTMSDLDDDSDFCSECKRLSEEARYDLELDFHDRHRPKACKAHAAEQAFHWLVNDYVESMDKPPFNMMRWDHDSQLLVPHPGFKLARTLNPAQVGVGEYARLYDLVSCMTIWVYVQHHAPDHNLFLGSLDTSFLDWLWLEPTEEGGDEPCGETVTIMFGPQAVHKSRVSF